MIIEKSCVGEKRNHFPKNDLKARGVWKISKLGNLFWRIFLGFPRFSKIFHVSNCTPQPILHFPSSA